MWYINWNGTFASICYSAARNQQEKKCACSSKPVVTTESADSESFTSNQHPPPVCNQ